MKRAAKPAALLLSLAALAGAVAGCGDDEEGDDVTIPTISVPETTSVPEVTVPTTPTEVTPTESGGTPPPKPPAQEDSATNDVPPPPGSPQEAFEKACRRTPRPAVKFESSRYCAGFLTGSSATGFFFFAAPGSATRVAE